MQVGFVDEASLFEERALDPADEILDRALLLRAVRPAQLDAHAQVERHASEGRVPLGDDAVLGPLERDRLGPIEDRDQRDTSPRSEVVDHRTHERLDLFVLDQTHLHPARILETRGEEVHALKTTVEVAHVNMPEVMLRELASESLEANDGTRPLGTQLLDELVERALAAGVALELRAAEKLDGEHVGLSHQLADDEAAKRLGL
jgi:hypothetical protein